MYSPLGLIISIISVTVSVDPASGWARRRSEGLPRDWELPWENFRLAVGLARDWGRLVVGWESLRPTEGLPRDGGWETLPEPEVSSLGIGGETG